MYSPHSTYVTTPSEEAQYVYIGNWCVDSELLYHRHPDETGADIVGGIGVIEYNVNDEQCEGCGAVCPNEIWLIHRLYQL